MSPEFDRSILGKVYDRIIAEPVRTDDLIAFARAVGSTERSYTEPGPDLVAHPTYCTRYRGRKFLPDDLPPAFTGRMSLDAGKDVELGAPIRPRDVLTVSTCVHDVYEKTGRTGSMIFLVVRFTITNQDGVRVATIDNRVMSR
jgi:hypothetical protein